MLGHQIGMVIKHINSALDHFVQKIFVGGIAHYRNKAQNIYQQRYCHKKQAAKPKQAKCLFPGKVGDGVPEKQDAKPCPCVNPGPFGGNAESHADTG